MSRVSQPVLPLLPAEARAVGPSVGLVEGPDGGVVFVFGLATFVYAAGDELGRRLAAVQLVTSRVAAAGEVAAAFGVNGVTLWRWGQDFGRDGVGGLVRERTGPRGPIKLTAGLAARIVALHGQGRSLRAIAAVTGVSTATVRVALGRVAPRPRAGTATEPEDVEEPEDIEDVEEPEDIEEPEDVEDVEPDDDDVVGAALVVLAAPVARTAERPRPGRGVWSRRRW